MEVPAELSFSEDHEWVRRTGNRARIGLTDFAQQALGDVVYVDLPEVGTEVRAGDVLGEVESTKSVSEIYAPLTGRVVEVNPTLVAAPGTLNLDCYGAGWICELEVDESASAASLLSAEQYGELTNS